MSEDEYMDIENREYETSIEVYRDEQLTALGESDAFDCD